MVADLIKSNVSSDEIRKFLNPILLESPDEFVIRDHINSAEQTIHHKDGKVVSYYQAQAPVDTRPTKPPALRRRPTPQGEPGAAPWMLTTSRSLVNRGYSR